jgi:hypothetical protein
VTLTGLTQAVGISAVDTLNLKIYGNNVQRAYIGLKVYADQKDVTGLRIIGNNFSYAGEFAIQYADSGQFHVGYSTVSENKLKYATGVALFLKAHYFELSDANNNDFYMSNNGIFFSGGSMKLTNLHLSWYKIQRVAVSIDHANALWADHLSLIPGGLPLPEQERVGLIAVSVRDVQLKYSYIKGYDIGVVLVAEGGLKSTATLKNSAIIDNLVVGIMIKTEDSISSFGAVNIFLNNLRRNGDDNAIWLVSPATIAPSSIQYGNGFY